MVVLRRLDALLEPTKEAVLEELRFQKEEAGFTDLDEMGLRDASGYVFYNTSRWTLQKLYDTATNSSQMLEANFTEYLNGFSANVHEIVDKFKLKSQIKHMADKDVLLSVLEKFTSSYINLTDKEALDPEGKKLPPLTNLGMGYVFEEHDPLDDIIKTFNERWFHGWEATPEEQRVKFISLMDKVKTHQDYKAKYAENLDEHTRRLALEKIVAEIMNRERKKELELYKLFAGDEAFKTGMLDSFERALRV